MLTVLIIFFVFKDYKQRYGLNLMFSFLTFLDFCVFVAFCTKSIKSFETKLSNQTIVQNIVVYKSRVDLVASCVRLNYILQKKNIINSICSGKEHKSITQIIKHVLSFCSKNIFKFYFYVSSIIKTNHLEVIPNVKRKTIVCLY